MRTNPERCGLCGLLLRNPREEMTRHGFGQCRLLPLWRYRSPSAACFFSPSRFEGMLAENTAEGAARD